MSALVGRHRELELLLSACKRGAGAVIVRGAPGVGKTRLLDAALGEAELQGFQVLRASFGDLDRDVPYVGLRVALLPRLESEEVLGDAAANVRSALDLELRDQGDEAPAAMATAFDAGRRLLSRWAERAPVVLALDDLHAADADSLRVVGLLVAHLQHEPITVLGTVRTSAPDVDTEAGAVIERLVTEGLSDVVDLEELDEAETRGLVHSLLGAPPDDGLVHTVRQAGRGNPFYVTEAVLGLRDDDRLVVDDGGARLRRGSTPITVSARAALLHRVFELGAPARQLVRVLTAFQRVTLARLDLAGEIAGLGERDVDIAFDRLVAAGLLRRNDEGGFEFTHPIVRTTLYEDIGPAERRRMHQRIAQRLQHDRDQGRPVSVGELAAHVAASAEPGDQDAVALLTRAGRDVMASAPLTAARWFAQARSLLAGPGVGDGGTGELSTAQLLALESRALFLASRTSDAAQVGQAALRCLRPGRDRARIAAVVVQSLATLGRFEDAVAVVEGLTEEERHLPRVRSGLAQVLILLDRFEAARAELDGVLADAQDVVSRSTALGALAAEAYARGDLERCLRYLDEQAALHDQLGPGARQSSLVVRSSYLALAGLLDQAQEVVAEARAGIDEIGGAGAAPMLDVASAICDWLAGRWDGVVEWSRRIGVDPDRAGVYGVLARIAELSVATDRGEFGRARELAEEVEASRLGSTFAAWAIGRVDLRLGEVDAARQRLTAAVERERASGRRSSTHVLLSALIELEAEAENLDVARRHVEALEELAADGTPWVQAMAARGRGTVDRDVQAATRSLALAEEHGFVVDAARSHLLLGELGGDDEHLLAAHEAFAEVRAEPELRRAVSLMRERGVAVPRSDDKRSGPLTDTDWELARLVHDGLTNRQIARVLYLSPKTVEVYLSRLFAKTSCANRLELALAVSEGRLES